MATLSDLIPDAQRHGKGVLQGTWAGIIASTPANLSDRVSVIIPDISLDHKWGPCYWQPRNIVEIPVIGDPCIVSFDNRRAPWVTTWWNQTVFPEGKWIKAVGGAAVWSFIQQSDLPSNLQADVGSPPGNDLNNATSSGWYAFTNTTANTPTTANQVGHVIVTSVYGGNIKQNLWDYFSNQQFVRSRNSALAWTSWVRADLLPRLIASAQLTGTITYSGSGPQVLGALPSAAYNGQQVELFATLGLASTGAAQTGQLWWGESGSPITNVHYFYVVGGGAANIVEVPLRTLVTPSAGNHTYQVLWSGGTNLVVDAANYTTPILTARYV